MRPQLPLPALPGGAWPASDLPWVEEPASWGSSGAEAWGPGEGGGFLPWPRRNSCRQRWGRGCAGIRESEVNYLSFERGKKGGQLWELTLVSVSGSRPEGRAGKEGSRGELRTVPRGAVRLLCNRQEPFCRSLQARDRPYLP